jgi:hypothetical protein
MRAAESLASGPLQPRGAGGGRKRRKRGEGRGGEEGVPCCEEDAGGRGKARNILMTC